MPTPRPTPHTHAPAPSEGPPQLLWLWPAWVLLGPLALLLPLLSGWLGVGPYREITRSEARYWAASVPAPLPELHASDPTGLPTLLGDVPPPAAHLTWWLRHYPAPTFRPAPATPRPLAFAWLGRRQLEGG